MTAKITFLDVGNADSIVLSVSPGRAIVIDIPGRKERHVEEWLQKRGVNTIECLYFTHLHRDHMPTLASLRVFIARWINSGDIKKLFLPSNALHNAVMMASDETVNESVRKSLQDALQQIRIWLKEKKISLYRSEDAGLPSFYDDTSISVLHPSFLFGELQPALHSRYKNETSLVLRVEHGSFCMLLLGDLEREGIAELLDMHGSAALKSHLVKIPHHGAWHINEEEFRELLNRIDPEIAILSVGSTNSHGHVHPNLFRELLDLKNSTDKSLQTFVCTEVTRTCFWSAIERRHKDREGLKAKRPCAGDIEIIFENDGSWTLNNSDVHQQVTQSVPRAACRGMAELD